MREICSQEYPSETGLAVIEQCIIRMRRLGWEKTSMRAVIIVEFEREMPDPPATAPRPTAVYPFGRGGQTRPVKKWENVIVECELPTDPPVDCRPLSSHIVGEDSRDI